MTRSTVIIISVALMAGIVGYLVGTTVRSIRNEKRKSQLQKTWAYFGLSIALCVLFFASWIGQAIAQWQEFKQTQAQHKEPATVSEFIPEFASRTLENWQSEFLQLFSFVVLSAILIHRGSAESKDSDDEIQESLKRIEDKLGTK